MSGSLGGLLADPTQRSTGLGGLLDQPPRPLAIQPPPEAGPNTNLASGWQQNAQLASDYIQQQRQAALDAGLWDPATGMPTGAGWADAASKLIGAIMPEREGEYSVRSPVISRVIGRHVSGLTAPPGRT